MEHGGGHHHGKDRPCRICKCADCDRHECETGRLACRTRGIDDSSAGHLSYQCHDAADGKHKADFDLGPFLGGQIHRDERAKSRLYVGEKENEPI